MPNFKPKNNKKLIIPNKTIVSLDSKHEEYLQQFNNDETITIPKLLNDRKSLMNEFNTENIEFDSKLNIKSQIKEIDAKINIIKNNKKNYLLNNSKYIFEYFQSKKEISSGNSSIKLLDTFFNIGTSDNSCNNNINKKNIQNYLRNTDPTYLDINNYVYSIDICRHCNQGELIPIDHEGIYVCNNCSRNTKFLVDNDKPSYKEPPKEVCFYAYKRINHFREILAQFQAKETTQIPEEVLNNIQLQIKKERLDIRTMNNKKTKDVLKKLGYNKYYEHIPFIKDKMGIKPPIMSPELEETLCNLFIDIQAPYAKYCPDDRVNFLNYYYTIYKLCELLEQKQSTSPLPRIDILGPIGDSIICNCLSCPVSSRCARIEEERPKNDVLVVVM